MLTFAMLPTCHCPHGLGAELDVDDVAAHDLGGGLGLAAEVVLAEVGCVGTLADFQS